uniref:Uncharacterized protein n=1 Tax=Neogobius melanostomus TaxID=47308 RepID=A0A8C6SIE2_9GOBI
TAAQLFRAVTDVDEDRARFFLESSGWNLQVPRAPEPCQAEREALFPGRVRGRPGRLLTLVWFICASHSLTMAPALRSVCGKHGKRPGKHMSEREVRALLFWG